MNRDNYKYQCLQCGECCKGNFEIFLEPEDINKWKDMGLIDLIEHIQLMPEYIAQKIEQDPESQEGKTLQKLRKRLGDKDFKLKLGVLKNFIEENHLYMGKDGTRNEIFTILPNMRISPILVPKSLEIILEGFAWGLRYVIMTDAYGICPFLKLNACSIHEIKPAACKRFPFDKHGNLKIDEHRLETCPGFKKITQK